jgi:hypothetical protein
MPAGKSVKDEKVNLSKETEKENAKKDWGKMTILERIKAQSK